jgi:hypothetical protein
MKEFWRGAGRPATCYNFPTMIDAFLVAEKTVVQAKGDGPAVEAGSKAGRVFLLTLDISQIIEQESLEISIFSSADGATWSAKPVVSFPQKFYRGEYPLLLDLTAHAEAKFVRAHWEVARWGRGVETPMFEFGLRLKEIPSEVLREVAGKVSVS